MKRNLLVIMSDEHRVDALGCAGHPFVETPHLDALAARGTRFTDAYTPSPICVPARAAFATGKHVHQTRHWDNAMPYTGTPESWGHVLQRAGVPVESIGKLHYRNETDPVGYDHEHIPMMVKDGVGMVFASIRREDERIKAGGRMLGDYIGPGDSNYTRYDEAVVKETTEWFQRKAESGDNQPWCLYVGMVAPHFPLVCPEPFFSKYRDMELPEPKLLPRDGYVQHPWVRKQNEFMNSEAKFKSEDERKDAIAAYWGLCSWMDNNVGEILSAMEHAGLDADVVYTSDHGDNVGTRGLWGKSNMYRESVSIPLIARMEGMPQGVCDTPVSLLDLSRSIPEAFGLAWDETLPGRPLQRIAVEPAEPDREILSQYHAAGAVSGSYMLRKGRWKYIEYVGFEPELFDLQQDPEETPNVATDRPEIVAQLATPLRVHLNLDETDKLAFADQDALVASHGGREAALQLGARGATPPPQTS